MMYKIIKVTIMLKYTFITMLMRLDNETGEAVCACVRVSVSLSVFHLGASLTRRQSE